MPFKQFFHGFSRKTCAGKQESLRCKINEQVKHKAPKIWTTKSSEPSFTLQHKEQAMAQPKNTTLIIGKQHTVEAVALTSYSPSCIDVNMTFKLAVMSLKEERTASKTLWPVYT